MDKKQATQHTPSSTVFHSSISTSRDNDGKNVSGGAVPGMRPLECSFIPASPVCIVKLHCVQAPNRLDLGFLVKDVRRKLKDLSWTLWRDAIRVEILCYLKYCRWMIIITE